MPEKIIYHIDVNSAFLSWEASHRVHTLGESTDLRDIPSAVAGDRETRHGVILAKSGPAKKYGITTGEPLVNALKKCPELVVVKPDFSLYVERSRQFIELLKRYAPQVEQYSIDEAYCDMTGTNRLYGDAIDFAHRLKDIIREELLFTVNVGVSNNKLLAKMASDFEKPDRVHTLFPDEIAEKLWPLPVSDLFFVGPATAKKLRSMGMKTIGDIAHTDKEILQYHFKKHGEVIWEYANGIGEASIEKAPVSNKGYSNSITVGHDVTDSGTAKRILLSLCETVGARLRADRAYISVVSVTLVDSEFNHHSRQMSLPSSTDVTEKIYESACALFDRLWDGEPIRLLGVQTSKATDSSYEQLNMFDMDKYERLSKLNSAIDSIRSRYGEDSIKRACFVNNEQTHMTGGLSRAKRDVHPKA